MAISMNRLHSMPKFLIGILALYCTSPVASAQVASSDAQFEQQIRPVLVAKCVKCHGAQKQEGGLRLDSMASMALGGESGAAVVAGLPEESLLIEALKYESFEMPPSGQLDEKTIKQFEGWIAAGAVWPEHSQEIRDQSGIITAEDRQWWAFQPIAKVDPPTIKQDDWSANAIDRFVLQQLNERGMSPAPQADKSTLVRRVYFDLIGLPPTPEEIAAFLADDSNNAWEHLIDRLLSDERYGEHWARYWLDLVRYCESDGWNQDAYRPHIWRYRDYVVDAFNSDKPYPEFVRQQLAGDEIPSDDPKNLIAAGYLRLGIYEYNQRDARGHWNDIVNEMTDVTGDVFLGLSMACCRCHDHKFDPLPQQDYFKLRAFFEPVIWRDDLTAATQQERQRYEQQHAEWEQATVELRRQIDELLAPYYAAKWESTVDKFPLDIQACFRKPREDRTSWEEQMAYLVSRQFQEEGGGPQKGIKKEDAARLATLEEQLAAFDELKPAPLPPLMTATDFAGPITATTIPEDAEQVPVSPGFLAVMTPPGRDSSALSTTNRRHATPGNVFVSTGQVANHTSGRRTRLAAWIGDPNNQLTMRVIVNRIWQQHFGQGIVATSSDFGRNGQLPSHPELLDWLTARFVEDGWSVKKLHKLILMSATWQQSAHHPQAAEYQSLDPSESLLWRARVRRLQAEQIRDAMLVVSGELDSSLGGPSVSESAPRRSLYVKSFRNTTDTFLHGFDMANGLKSVAIRDSTTTPTQALLLINGEYSIGRAKQMAQRLIASHGADPNEAVRRSFVHAWGREPRASELESATRFVSSSDNGGIDADRFADFCHVLLNSNNFLYLE
jgi:cytochrome c553